ncbi:hypothetical protein [Roseovarius pacificus]|uniref:hypothetical protein n=1 Tax=Roseovarius pacificus TaxID=337701 RepID=UPI0040397B5A
MHRVKELQGEDVRFTDLTYGDDEHYRVEIKVDDIEGIRRLRDQGILISVRMIGRPTGRKPQRTLVPHREIQGL